MIYAIVSIIALALLSIAVYLIRREGKLGERISYSDKIIKAAHAAKKISASNSKLNDDELRDKLRNDK